MADLKTIIDGKEVESSSGQRLPVINPANEKMRLRSPASISRTAFSCAPERRFIIRNLLDR